MVSSINPSLKGITVLIPGVLLSFSFDIYTPLVFLIFMMLFTFLFSGIPLKKWLLFFTPFIIVALGFAWMTMLYTSESFAGGEHLFSIWRFDVTTGAVMTGISLALRSLCFITLSLLFILTTDSTKFMLSLMQQLKMPPKLTYGILAGYRFLPAFRHEFHILKQAHRIRGVGRARGIKDRLEQMRRYAIPLMANAIRKAERVANAMESKGFTGSHNRTHYHYMKINKKDWMFFSVINGALVLTFVSSYFLGYLNIFGIRVG
ncbi:energy-coupling factor transporter transmembrane component T family protein [Alkalicoccus daliensis]|uniref:Energy-coupling factor transport system permease protein n=1 Tax=Alkalicoccus daliensis TaxID=745820 RepID=A0A1H0KKP8_9BACI|nr:energy-coupling factor transporter transmembrane component T [Alkalicoccus daliensis]SDO56574.1 energy-coupling factor transport system permease protein [Alkalicoccus daliensis]